MNHPKISDLGYFKKDMTLFFPNGSEAMLTNIYNDKSETVEFCSIEELDSKKTFLEINDSFLLSFNGSWLSIASRIFCTNFFKIQTLVH